MERKNNQKGITLVALVVTIVVLLILAGITISVLFGDNGIIRRAEQAKQATEDDTANTEAALQNLALQMDSILGYTASSVKAKATEFYGLPVTNYEVGDTTLASTLSDIEWQIFYSDGSNIYLIASDYVPVSALAVPLDASGNNGTALANTNSSYHLAAPLTNGYSSYANSGRITNTSLNSSYFKLLNGSTSSNNNIRAVAYMLDTNAWSKYAGSSASYAIGGPTVEMLLNSYCEYYANDTTIQGIKNGVYKYQAKAVDTSTGITLKQGSVSCAGYVINNNYGADDSWATYYDGMLSTNPSDNMYVRTTYTNKACAYWVASPSAGTTSSVMGVNYYGIVDFSSYYSDTYGFRPVVSLKSNVQLEAQKDSDGNVTGYIIK